jgi:hypothetical protein
MSKPQYLFYGEILKGYYFKVIIDVLASSLKRLTFGFTESGIAICQMNEKQNMLFRCLLQREKFTKYHFTEIANRSVNASHIRKQLRTVKKKDQISLFMYKDDPAKNIYISITPENNGKTMRSETNSVASTEEDELTRAQYPPKSNYYHPYVMDSSGFQKIKKQTSYNKDIIIEMNEDKFLSFYCDVGTIFSSRLSFGDPVHSTPKYTGVFNHENINSLIKLPGLNRQMQFFSPKEQKLPLLIHVDAENLGFFEVFVAKSPDEEDETEEEVAPVRHGKK